jgi:hypothetical protein
MANLAIGKELTGKGEKPHDRFTIPLCPYHHRIGIDCQHNSNEQEWWERTGLNPWAIAASLWIASGGAERALQPPRPKRERPVKARKPRQMRVKIRSNSKIASRPFPKRGDAAARVHSR